MGSNDKHVQLYISLTAANMDTIGTFEMAKTFTSHGLIVAIHKHYSPDQWIQFAKGKGFCHPQTLLTGPMDTICQR